MTSRDEVRVGPTRSAPVPPRLAVRAAIAARRALQRAADRVVPAGVAVFERSTGVGATLVLGLMAELDIAGRLAGGPRTAADLAGEIGCDEDVLHRVLRASAVFDFVRLDGDGRFAATRLTRALRRDDPRATGAWCRYMASEATIDAWQALPVTVRSGRSGFRHVHGESTWEWFNGHPDEQRTFAAAMRGLTEAEAPGIVRTYPFPTSGTVCDVAGGTGTLLGHVLRARPHLRGILVDGPAVLGDADPHLTAIGVRERVTLCEGDIFERFDAAADLYLLKNVLHDWDDGACRRILGNVAATMPAGARLLIVEGTLDRNEPHPFFATADLQMMMVCEEGRERSVDELQDLLRSVGLQPGGVRRTPTDVALVEATRPS